MQRYRDLKGHCHARGKESDRAKEYTVWSELVCRYKWGPVSGNYKQIYAVNWIIVLKYHSLPINRVYISAPLILDLVK